MIAKSMGRQDGSSQPPKVGISLATKTTGVVAVTIAAFMALLTYLSCARTESVFGKEIDAFGVNVAKALAAPDVSIWDANAGTLLQTIHEITEGAEKYPDYLATKFGITVKPPEGKVRGRNLPPEFYAQQEAFLAAQDQATERNNLRLSSMISHTMGSQKVPAEIVDAFILVANGEGSLARARQDSAAFRTEGDPEPYRVSSGDGIIETDATIQHGTMEGTGNVRSYTYPIRDLEGNATHRAYVFLSQSRLDQQVTALRNRLLLFLFVFTVIGAAVTYLLTRKMTSPILDLVDEAAHVSYGESHHHSHVHTDDEIGLLARTMDSMVRRLDHARQEHDHRFASDVHKKLMPEAIPYIPNYEVDVVHRLSDSIGATYYDFLSIPGGKFGFVVAQASKKGIAAAMNVMTTGMLLRTECVHESDPVALLERVNDSLYESLHHEMSVSVLLGVLDPKSKTLIVASAGRLPLLVGSLQANEVEVVERNSVPLGQVGGDEFRGSVEVWDAELDQGDRVMLTNGAIASIQNEQGTALDQGKWLHMLQEAQAGDRGFANSLRDALVGFAGKAAPDEDILVVSIFAEKVEEASAAVAG